MTRIAIDPEELGRFAGLTVEAADDYSSRAARLRGTDRPPMPPDIAATVNDALHRIAGSLDHLAMALYGEALVLRTRAAVFDPATRSYVLANLQSLPE